MLNRSLLYCLLICLLAACTPTALPQPTETATTSHTRAATRPVTLATPRPSNTPAPLPTGTRVQKPTATLVPTLMPIPTLRPTATPVPLPAGYNLPAWVNDPQAAVMAAILRSTAYGEDYHITLLNADTGEQFELLPGHMYGRWRQNGPDAPLVFYLDIWNFETYNQGYNETFEIDIHTGRVSQVPFSDRHRRKFTPGGRYLAERFRHSEREEVRILDLERNQEVVLPDPFNGRYPHSLEIEWSADGSLLAVQRTELLDEVEAATRTRPSTGLALYTVDGRLYRYHDGVRQWGWAPDGSFRLLTMVGSYFGNGEPCILDAQTGTTECLPEVAAWRESSVSAASMNTGDYQWLPDGSGLSFMYWDNSAGTSGLCILDLSGRDITCPIDETMLAPANFGVDAGGSIYIVQYEWSPDGRYIMLEVDSCGPGCHDRALVQVATIARDGSDFRLWGFGWTATYRGSGAWRPLLGGDGGGN